MRKSTLSPAQLTRPCQLKDNAFKLPQKFNPIIGQDKAFDALDFGLNILAPRYNMYCMGEKGLGRTSLSMQKIQEKALNESTPPDYCYVYNFEQPRFPLYLSFPAGQALEFQKHLKKTIAVANRFLIRAALEDSYRLARQLLEEKVSLRRQNQFKQLQNMITSKNVALVQTEEGQALFPCLNKKIMQPADFNQLPLSKRKPIIEQLEKAREKLTRLLSQSDFDSFYQDQLEILQKQTVQNIVQNVFKSICQKYRAHESVLSYLNNIQKDLLENAPAFFDEKADLTPCFMRYQVNILTTHQPKSGAPVVHLTLPSVQNLLGKIDRIPQKTDTDIDFLLIQAGALHQANGGYLLIETQTLTPDAVSWKILKQCLYSRQIKMETNLDESSIFNMPTILPQPIPLDVKVVLIGNSFAAFKRDEDFKELFKIPIFFSEKIARTSLTEKHYGQILNAFIQKEHLKPFTTSALCRLIEYASRLTGDQNSLSLYLSDIYDLMREASFWTHGKQVDAKDIDLVRLKRENQTNDYQTNLLDRIKSHDLLIDLKGMKSNQINGLSVLFTDSVSFAVPSRITCQIRAGSGKIMDTENEVKLAGQAHMKSFLILTSYLAAQFGNPQKLPIDATLTFEQSFSERDGDSASAASLLCLLSAIGKIPLNQGIAVTGSVDQLGNLQPIGMVNEKIEGFFKACQTVGLTGKQGVLIPVQNKRDLMLNNSVIEAVRKKKFHIYTATHIEEALEILSNQKYSDIQKKIQKNLAQFSRKESLKI